jgi:hypothetical protein
MNVQETIFLYLFIGVIFTICLRIWSDEKLPLFLLSMCTLFWPVVLIGGLIAWLMDTEI